MLFGQPGQAYNVGGGNERENLAIARIILDELDAPNELLTDTDRQGHTGAMPSTPPEFGHSAGTEIDWSGVARDDPVVPRQSRLVGADQSGEFAGYYRSNYAASRADWLTGMLSIEIAVAKTAKYASRDSGDTRRDGRAPDRRDVDGAGRRPGSGHAAKSLSMMVSSKAVALLKEGVRDGASARATHDFLHAYRHGRVRRRSTSSPSISRTRRSS